jgi:RNA polymerase sigma-70 factor (ECF subfamily)
LPGEQRFDEFYAAVFGRLVGQLYLVTGDPHDAEDVVQEALTRAAARWSRLREYAVPEAWVRRVAVNLATDRSARRPGRGRARRPRRTVKSRLARARRTLAASLAPDEHGGVRNRG